MKNFAYYRPKTVEEAVGLLDNQWGRTELLAGGTDLHDLQKEYVAQPEKVVSLNGVRGGFRESVATGPPGAYTAYTIGAGVRLTDIAASPLLAAVPALTS